MVDVTWKEGRAFTSFANWECYQNGYYRGGECGHDNVDASADLLCSSLFMESMRSLVLCWPVTTAIHLSNNGINRRAWLGQMACYFEVGNCDRCTVMAWLEMSRQNQQAANLIANEMVIRWNQVNSDSVICRPQNTQLELTF